ncbi:TonB-dependent receptor [Wenyingzhuangia sp. IMCC45533]
MKLTAYLILLSLFQINANTTFSQNAKVTLDLNNVTYYDVFRAIESQTEYHVLYNHNEFNPEKQVSVKFENAPIFDVLTSLFKGTDILYKTVGRQIVLTNKKKSIDQKEQQQNKITVQGNVKGKDGEPILGANIIEKGTQNGAITDFDGNYVIKVSRNATLVFSYVGYQKQEITVNGQNTIDVVLEQSVSELDAVVLVGYGTVKKSDITGALTSVSPEELQKTQTTSVAQAIQGRAAGVTVVKSSGEPGAAPNVRIRGIGTVNNADPLYVVDGVPINDITNINMDDAESIEVLKDASATAIYGSRGANGVVLITTKGGGKNKKPLISYRTYVGVEERIDNLEVLDAQQWATIYNEGRVNDGDPIRFNDVASLPNFNWKDEVYRTGEIQSHQLSVSGGTEKSTYYISLGNISQKGIIKNTDFERTNFRVNNTYQIKPKIKIGQNIQYAKSESNAVASFGSNSNFKTPFIGYIVDPISPIFTADGTPASPEISTEIRNPAGLVRFDQTPLEKESFLGNIFLEAELMKGLIFRSNYGLEINYRKVDNFQPSYFISALQNRSSTEYSLSRSENRVSILSNTLNYTSSFSDNHQLTVLLGQETQNLDFNNVVAGRSGIGDNIQNPTLSSGAVDTSTNSGRISASTLISYFGRLNYNYKDRYLFTGTYRVDGSSRFGENNKFAKFPSFALAWNIHNENFYDLGVLNQFKFRLGWGETGNQNIPNAAIFSSLNTNVNYLLGGDEAIQTGVAPLRPGNADLKWEATTTSNVGLDLAFLKNSLTLTADYFVRTTSNMLLESPILDTSGFVQPPTINAGEIENKGFEFSLNYKKRIKDFFFSVGGNISFIDNKVISLASQGSSINTGRGGNGFQNISRTEAGQPLASFYGLDAIGIFQNQDEIDNNPSLAGNQPGDVRYRDLNGDKVINDDDRTFIGSPLPDFTYGINLDFSYKQFDLSMFFQGSQGNEIFNATGFLLEGALDTNLSTDFLGRWTGEGTSNTTPRATFDGFANNNRLSDRFVEDGSYLRLKNIQLGYSIPEKVLNNTFMSKARIYVAGQNLLTFTNYSGLDPELGIDGTQTQNGSRTTLDIGIDRGRYPSTRTVSLGLDINF